jgi:hypothetical protein
LADGKFAKCSVKKNWDKNPGTKLCIFPQKQIFFSKKSWKLSFSVNFELFLLFLTISQN